MNRFLVAYCFFNTTSGNDDILENYSLDLILEKRARGTLSSLYVKIVLCEDFFYGNAHKTRGSPFSCSCTTESRRERVFVKNLFWRQCHDPRGFQQLNRILFSNMRSQIYAFSSPIYSTAVFSALSQNTCLQQTKAGLEFIAPKLIEVRCSFPELMSCDSIEVFYCQSVQGLIFRERKYYFSWKIG